LIDHIKTAVDVDPWAKEMVEDLLKEQEVELQKGRYYSDVFDIGYKAGKESIVRCKDCKYAAPDMVCSHESEWGNEISRNRSNPNWFCADGVAKDINVPDKEGR
jgi:hypothetical protein